MYGRGSPRHRVPGRRAGGRFPGPPRGAPVAWRCERRAPDRWLGCRALLGRDARLPEERRRLRQGRRVACSPTASSRRTDAGDADLVVVNTCAFVEAARRESVETILELAEARKARRPARRHGLPGRALRARARRGASPRSTPSSGSRARARSARCCSTLPRRKPTGVRDLLELPRAVPSAPVGLREGRRGVRPRLRVLRDPVVPGQAAVPDARTRSSPRRAASSRAASAELVLVAQDLAWYGRDVGEPGSLAPLLRRLDAELGPLGLAPRPAPLPLPERGPGPARRDDARARRPSSRTSTCRSSTPTVRCSRG